MPASKHICQEALAMANSDTKERAQEIIAIITAKLNPGLLSRRFDEPITKVAQEFECQAEYPVAHKDFHRIIADFTRRIYAKALKASWRLTDPLDEAIVLLENGYRSALYGPGYTAAMLHTNDPEKGGIEVVLAALARAIMEMERQKYIDGVLTWHLRGCSWQLLCAIAQQLMEDYQPFIPPQLHERVPAQLVDVLADIMQRCVDSHFTLQGFSWDR